MVYYIKQGQSSIFQNIKFLENECQIAKMTPTINNRKLEKIVKKIKKKQIEQLILSNQLKQNEEFIKILNNYDITILDGKWLMQYMLQDIIEYMKEKGKVQATVDEVSILVNDLTSEVRQNIKKIATQYKKIRIVTNHLEKFKKIEEELYETNGVPIIITNNKRKALAKSALIVNFDFAPETINQYNINENAVIINLYEKIRINKKRFCGYVITDYEVEFQNCDITDKVEFLNWDEISEKEKEFSLKEILEEKIYSNIGNQPNSNMFETVKSILKKNNIKIKELYGINGILA